MVFFRPALFLSYFITDFSIGKDLPSFLHSYYWFDILDASVELISSRWYWFSQLSSKFPDIWWSTILMEWRRIPTELTSSYNQSHWVYYRGYNTCDERWWEHPTTRLCYLFEVATHLHSRPEWEDNWSDLYLKETVAALSSWGVKLHKSQHLCEG